MERELDISKGSVAEDAALGFDRQVDYRVRQGVRACWSRGQQDGLLRADYTRGRLVAERDAEDVFGYIETHYRGEDQTRKQEENWRLEVLNEAEKDLATAREHRIDLEKVQRRNPRQFSGTLGVFYLLSAIVLVLADIPLAVSLTADAFGYNMIRTEDLRKITTAPLDFFGDNWQALLVSTGIAFFAVFIKIFWDEFVERPPELGVMTDKDLRWALTEEEARTVRWQRRWRVAVKTFVLLLTFVTLLTLGLLRNQVDERNQQDIMAGDFMLNPDAWAYSDENPEPRPGDPIAVRDSSGGGTRDVDRPDKNASERGWFLWAFICITFMFPLIGGVTASLGLSYLEARRALRMAWSAEKAKRVARDSAFESMRQATFSATRSGVRVARIEQSDYGQNLRNLFTASYEHGYQTGFLSPSAEGDSFVLAQRFHQWSVSQRILATLWTTTPPHSSEPEAAPP